VCTVAVALYARNYVLAALMSLTTFITFSTVNVMALVLLWLGTGWSAAAQQREAAGRAAATIVVVGVGAAAVVGLAGTGYATEIIFAKLGTSELGSKLDRLDQVVAGLRMFADYPLTGVGISQYGYHYKAYQLTSLFGGGELIKPIANNVYVELLAETGVVGTAMFGLFLARIYRRARAPRLAPLRWGLVAILLVFNACPSYTIMFLWAFWGLILAAAARGAGPAPARA
jgi:O-antigen ligase